MQKISKEIIKRIVNRFLCWKLPENFHPDCGISFKQFSDYDHPQFGRHKSEPIGTNLFTADQAKQMIEHCLADELEQHGIEQEYVPMTDDEWQAVDYAMYYVVSATYRKLIEQAVLARLGVAPNHIPDVGKMVLDQAKAICEANGLAVVPIDILDNACELLEINGEHSNDDYKALKAVLEAAKEVK